MANRTASFRQSDLSRALKAAVSAGVEVGRIEIDPSGKIVIVSARQDAQPKNDLDKWLSDNAD